MLTKTDVQAIRGADDLVIHLNSKHPQGMVRLIKRKPFNSKPFETDQEYVLENVTVQMDNWRHRELLASSDHVSCFSMTGLYHSQKTPASSIMLQMRAGDEVTFSFSPDYHSNGYVAAAGLHADVLTVAIRRNGKTIANYELDQSICANNSARMCRGFPTSESYNRAAADRLANA